MYGQRLPRILVTGTERIPSVELGAIVPLSELQKRGVCEFRYKDELWLLPSDVAWSDILLLVRGASVWSVQAARWAKQHGRIVLGYWDDNLLAIPEYSLTYPYYSSPRVRANIDTLFKLTDAFFCPNPKLAAKLSACHGREVKLLPGVHGREGFEPPKERAGALPVVGYSGGPDHIKILNSLVGPVLWEVGRAGVNFKVHIVGPKPDFIGKLPVETKHTPFIGDYYSYLDFASKLEWDIGLAPQVDSEFTTYKTYIKFLEYTDIGCAGIYTKIEPYLGIIEDSVTGLLVPNEIGAWSDGILRLLRDPALRFRIASNAYEFAQANHSRKAVVEKYAAALAPFLSHRGPPVNKVYAVASSPIYMLNSICRGSREYMKIYGLRRLLRRAPPQAASLLRRRMMRRRTGK